MRATRLVPAMRIGLIAGLALVFIVTIGFVETVARREVLTDLLSLSTTMIGMVAVLTGVVAARPTADAGEPLPGTAALRGAVAGLVAAVVVTLFAAFSSAVDLSHMFPNLRGHAFDTVTFGLDLPVAAVVLAATGAILGALGGILRALPPLPTRMVVTAGIVVVVLSIMEQVFRVMLTELGLRDVARFFYASGALTVPGAVVVAILAALGTWLARAPQSPVRAQVQRVRARTDRRTSVILYVLVGLALLILPQLIGRFPSDVVGNAGLYLLLGLGLNIVVGYAGLLDLGYVAFFAIGAYSVALMTSPQSFLDLQWNFWLILPLVMVLAATAGIVIGAPVLRLRGDYLAIVTLGFGEIVRLLFLSDWLKPWTGAGQGVLGIPGPTLPALEVPSKDPESIYYPILFFCVLGAIVAYRLANSRVGRAWNAMREDESVAEATGINTTNYKLLAFALGAVFGCLSGALFAAKIGVVFPHSFEIIVSITALAVIILGGMGSIPGVVVGALVLVGLPELLREFDEYRLLVYGAVLVAMMLLRPEGLVPSAMRQRELHESDEPEDQYDEEAGVDTGRPAVSGGAA
ncbi:MAG TPA: leucine/isoleucine/valine transporter permease subunit [Candidatus Limnocylindria bacterium]|nr:leucine/isoleucine/valine transporter permease subunit [Candidatus Limnocylindria bacterium]